MFDSLFGLMDDDMWFPIIASAIEEECEERDFNDISDEEIRSYYENEELG